MGETLRSLVVLVQAAWAEWGEIRLTELHFSQGSTARNVVVALVGIAIGVLILRMVTRAAAHRGRVALPALVTLRGPARLAIARHGALLLGLAGLPFFILALADPRTAVTREEVSYPGRRISLMIDASSSMLTALPANRFAEGAPNNAAFFTTVGAARYFIERRMSGTYRDLMALIEFGDDAYVITPFTTDYENILLSTSLIGDWQEFMSFPDQGTVIARAVQQSVAMFEAFKYLDAAGNLMVIFSDGADAEVLESGKSAFDVVEEAAGPRSRSTSSRSGARYRVGRRSATRCGGRRSSAPAAASIPARTRRPSSGRCRTSTAPRRDGSSSIQHRAAALPPFAMAAAGLWALALLLRLTMPVFGTFP